MFTSGILPAVERVVALGLADPERVFLVGESGMGRWLAEFCNEALAVCPKNGTIGDPRMLLAHSTQEYIDLTAPEDSPFLKTRKQIEDWIDTDPMFRKLSDDQLSKFKQSIHYHSAGSGIGDFYFADLESALTPAEFEGFLARIGIAPGFFSIVRDHYCYDAENCRSMAGYACSYLHGMGCT